MQSAVQTLLLLVLGLIAPAFAAFEVQRVEPPFWWVGMHHATVQIAFYGPDVGAAKPSITSEHASIATVQRVDSRNYLFLDIAISPHAKSGPIEIELTDGEHQTTVNYELRARKDGSAARRGFNPADVIYLITPDRFANGDPKNDQVDGYGDILDRGEPYARHGGDIQGIIDHLDYIADMGFTQIWLNPVLENAEAEQSYHGYAVTDLYRVDPRLGSNELYLELSRCARERGIGLIQDVIPNHIGSQHGWMRDPPTSDWIHNGGTFTPTNHRRESLHDPHASKTDRDAFADGWFVPSMPDLNQDQPQLAEYLIQNTIWWIEYADLSGLRVDTWPYSGKTFLAQWSRRIMAEYPNLNIVGEEWSIEPELVSYWQRGAPRFDNHDTALPSLMDFPLQDALVRGLTEPSSWSDGVARIYSTLAADFLYGNPYNLVTFADNHDMSRLFTQLDHDTARFDMAMRFLLTTRGIPQIFYGTEVLMSNPGTDSHGIIRSDFPGGWADDETSAFSGQGLDVQAQNAQQKLRRLLNWRKTASAIHSGKLTHFVPQVGLYVYFRHVRTDALPDSFPRAPNVVMVAMNTGDADIALDTARFAEITSNHNVAIEALTRDRYALDKPLFVPATTTMIWELQ